MAKTLNRVEILGRLGQEPELRSTPQGKSVCTLNIATNESYKDNSGEWKESTDWHRVVLWERLADVAAQYLKKGSQVFIEGKLKTRSYEQNGETKYITEVLGRNLILLDSRGGADSYSNNSYSQQNSPSEPEPPKPNIENTEEDDDVPF